MILGMMLVSLTAFGQNPINDLELVEAQNIPDPTYEDYRPKYMFKDSRAIVKYSPPAIAFGGLMFAYQQVISVQLSSSCLYSVSCSRFSVSAIKRYGLIKGVMLSADRLARCNQIAGIDVHPLKYDSKVGKVHDHLDYYKKKR